jgi:uncharacterized membrane protein
MATDRPMNQRWQTGRVKAFSDGVFAIAITLLVLEIKVEPEQFEHLRGRWRTSGRRTWPT